MEYGHDIKVFTPPKLSAKVIKFNFFANLLTLIVLSSSKEIIPPKTDLPSGFFCCFLAIVC